MVREIERLTKLLDEKKKIIDERNLLKSQENQGQEY